jgi:hypothetical protein
MPRTITKDTKKIKDDLEKIVESGEQLIKSQKWKRLGYGAVISGDIFRLYQDSSRLKTEVDADASVVNKKAYFAQAIRESANHLADYFIKKYL